MLESEIRFLSYSMDNVGLLPCWNLSLANLILWIILVCEHLDLLVVPKITSMDGITSIIHTYIQYIFTNVLTIYTIYIHTYNTYILIIQMLTRLYS